MGLSLLAYPQTPKCLESPAVPPPSAGKSAPPAKSVLPGALESWHAVLLPVTHRGECNHLDREGRCMDLASQVFAPHTVGDHGFTICIWRDDASMLAVPKAENIFDRSFHPLLHP